MFDDIRPYYDSEINAAMNRIADNPTFAILSSYTFPEMSANEARNIIRSIDNIRDFQINVMQKANRQIMSKSISEFTYTGLEHVEKEKAYLFVSNHRDIMLDAALLQVTSSLSATLRRIM